MNESGGNLLFKELAYIAQGHVDKNTMSCTLKVHHASHGNYGNGDLSGFITEHLFFTFNNISTGICPLSPHNFQN